MPPPSQRQNPQESPIRTESPKPLVMEMFQGMDQSGNRASVEDKQVWWCDGWIPLNERHLRTMWGIGDAIFTTVVDATGNDTYTKILLHFDGTDASTDIPDSNVGGLPHTWTVSGSAQLDTAAFKFGTASLLLDGTTDYVSTPASADFALGSGAFTIDFWFNCDAAGGTVQRLCGQADSGPTITTQTFNIRRLATNVIAATATVSSTPFLVTGTTTFTNAVNTGWHHCAFVRTGNILKLFIDGVQEGGDLAITGSVNTSVNNVSVGALGENTATTWTGWIDEFRLSVGIARWTTDFIPPTSAYAPVSSLSNIVFYDFANIEAMPLAIIFLADGSIVQVNTLSGVATTIAPTGTITDPSRANCDISQWGNQYVIIVATQTDGYFLWDGALLYHAGTLAPGITMQYVGAGYSSAPTVTAYGGSGSGVTLNAIIAGGVVTGVSITAIGSGYVATDAVGLAFSGGAPTVATAIITPVLTGGVITSTVLTDPGNGYADTNIVASVVGGGGSGASLSLNTTSGTV